MDKEKKKNVDQKWLEQVSREKANSQLSDVAFHQPTFPIFLSSLSMQAMIALGKVENPLTGQLESNPEQARFLIDTLAILKEKTSGNLSSEEEILLDDYLYNLRLMYMEGKPHDR